MNVTSIPFQATLVDVIGSEPAPWLTRAACRGLEGINFFPERGEDPRPAKAVCAQCPVRTECLNEFMDEPVGIFGGLSGRERRKIKRERRNR